MGENDIGLNISVNSDSVAVAAANYEKLASAIAKAAKANSTMSSVGITGAGLAGATAGQVQSRTIATTSSTEAKRVAEQAKAEIAKIEKGLLEGSVKNIKTAMKPLTDMMQELSRMSGIASGGGNTQLSQEIKTHIAEIKKIKILQDNFMKNFYKEFGVKTANTAKLMEAELLGIMQGAGTADGAMNVAGVHNPGKTYREAQKKAIERFNSQIQSGGTAAAMPEIKIDLSKVQVSLEGASDRILGAAGKLEHAASRMDESVAGIMSRLQGESVAPAPRGLQAAAQAISRNTVAVPTPSLPVGALGPTLPAGTPVRSQTISLAQQKEIDQSRLRELDRQYRVQAFEYAKAMSEKAHTLAQFTEKPASTFYGGASARGAASELARKFNTGQISYQDLTRYITPGNEEYLGATGILQLRTGSATSKGISGEIGRRIKTGSASTDPKKIAESIALQGFAHKLIEEEQIAAIAADTSLEKVTGKNQPKAQEQLAMLRRLMGGQVMDATTRGTLGGIFAAPFAGNVIGANSKQLLKGTRGAVGSAMSMLTLNELSRLGFEDAKDAGAFGLNTGGLTNKEMLLQDKDPVAFRKIARIAGLMQGIRNKQDRSQNLSKEEAIKYLEDVDPKAATRLKKLDTLNPGLASKIASGDNLTQSERRTHETMNSIISEAGRSLGAGEAQRYSDWESKRSELTRVASLKYSPGSLMADAATEMKGMGRFLNPGFDQQMIQPLGYKQSGRSPLFSQLDPDRQTKLLKLFNDFSQPGNERAASELVSHPGYRSIYRSFDENQMTIDPETSASLKKVLGVGEGGKKNWSIGRGYERLLRDIKVRTERLYGTEDKAGSRAALDSFMKYGAGEETLMQQSSQVARDDSALNGLLKQKRLFEMGLPAGAFMRTPWKTTELKNVATKEEHRLNNAFAAIQNFAENPAVAQEALRGINPNGTMYDKLLLDKVRQMGNEAAQAARVGRRRGRKDTKTTLEEQSAINASSKAEDLIGYGTDRARGTVSPNVTIPRVEGVNKREGYNLTDNARKNFASPEVAMAFHDAIKPGGLLHAAYRGIKEGIYGQDKNSGAKQLPISKEDQDYYDSLRERDARAEAVTKERLDKLLAKTAPQREAHEAARAASEVTTGVSQAIEKITAPIKGMPKATGAIAAEKIAETMAIYNSGNPMVGMGGGLPPKGPTKITGGNGAGGDDGKVPPPNGPLGPLFGKQGGGDEVIGLLRAIAGNTAIVARAVLTGKIMLGGGRKPDVASEDTATDFRGKDFSKLTPIQQQRMLVSANAMNQSFERNKNRIRTTQETTGAGRAAGIDRAAIADARFEQGEGALTTTMRRVLMFGGTSMMVYKAVGALQQFGATVVNMDKQLADLRKTLGGTDADFAKLADRAMSTAKATGTKTQDVLDATELFSKQFKNPNDLATLSKSAALFSNLSGQSIQSSVETITSAIEQYNLSVSQAGKLTDSWAQMAANANVTTKDLGDAFGAAGGAAKEAGVTVDELNAIVTTIVASTGKTGKDVGSGIKRMIERVASPENEKKLAKEGIATRIRGVDGQLESRDFMAILNDIDKGNTKTGVSWDNMSSAQKRNIAVLIAGARQYDAFIALMNNYAKTKRLVNDSENSEGVAMQQNERLMNTLSKKFVVFHDEVDSLARSVGMVLVPAFGSLVTVATSLLKVFSAFPSVTMAISAVGLAKGMSGMGNLLLRGTVLGKDQRTGLEAFRNPAIGAFLGNFMTQPAIRDTEGSILGYTDSSRLSIKKMMGGVSLDAMNGVGLGRVIKPGKMFGLGTALESRAAMVAASALPAAAIAEGGAASAIAGGTGSAITGGLATLATSLMWLVGVVAIVGAALMALKWGFGRLQEYLDKNYVNKTDRVSEDAEQAYLKSRQGRSELESYKERAGVAKLEISSALREGKGIITSQTKRDLSETLTGIADSVRTEHPELAGIFHQNEFGKVEISSNTIRDIERFNTAVENINTEAATKSLYDLNDAIANLATERNKIQGGESPFGLDLANIAATAGTVLMKSSGGADKTVTAMDSWDKLSKDKKNEFLLGTATRIKGETGSGIGTASDTGDFLQNMSDQRQKWMHMLRMRIPSIEDAARFNLKQEGLSDAGKGAPEFEKKVALEVNRVIRESSLAKQREAVANYLSSHTDKNGKSTIPESLKSRIVYALSRPFDPFEVQPHETYEAGELYKNDNAHSRTRLFRAKISDMEPHRIDYELNKSLTSNYRNASTLGAYQSNFLKNTLSAYDTAIMSLNNDIDKAAGPREASAMKLQAEDMTSLKDRRGKLASEYYDLAGKVSGAREKNAEKDSSLSRYKEDELAVKGKTLEIQKEIDLRKISAQSIQEENDERAKLRDSIAGLRDVINTIVVMDNIIRPALKSNIAATLTRGQTMNDADLQSQTDLDYLDKQIARAKELQQINRTAGTAAGRNELNALEQQKRDVKKNLSKTLEANDFTHNLVKDIGQSTFSSFTGMAVDQVTEMGYMGMLGDAGKGVKGMNPAADLLAAVTGDKDAGKRRDSKNLEEIALNTKQLVDNQVADSLVGGVSSGGGVGASLLGKMGSLKMTGRGGLGIGASLVGGLTGIAALLGGVGDLGSTSSGIANLDTMGASIQGQGTSFTGEGGGITNIKDKMIAGDSLNLGKSIAGITSESLLKQLAETDAYKQGEKTGKDAGSGMFSKGFMGKTAQYGMAMLGGAAMGNQMTAAEGKVGIGGTVGGAVGTAVGLWAGTQAGAYLGGEVGSTVGPVGTVVGAVVGAVGGLLGAWIGSQFDKPKDPELKKLPEIEDKQLKELMKINKSLNTVNDTMENLINAPSNFTLPIPKGILNNSVTAQSAIATPLQSHGLIIKSGPAYLHAGERVVDGGSGGGINVQNSFVIQGANKDPKEIANEVAGILNRQTYNNSQRIGGYKGRF